MSLVQVVKCDAASESELVWKYPGDKLAIGSQVIVNQSQSAIFVKGGQVFDILGPGTHTLSTANIPFLSKLINLPFGGKTPFSAEVWFVNRTAKRDLRWGTPHPIQLLDPQFSFPISIRAFGRWGIRVEDPQSFVVQLVGSRLAADADMVDRFFIGEIVQKLNGVLATAVSSGKAAALTISSSIDELSTLTNAAVTDEFRRFGVELVNFNIESISVPDSEMKRLQDVLGKRMEVEQLSNVNAAGAYTTVKTFETLRAAAENPGQGGAAISSMLGAGLALGAALPLGQQMGRAVASDLPQPADAYAKLKQLKQLFDEGLIGEEQYRSKQQEILGTL